MLQLDPLIWETAIPRTHKPKIVNESLNHPGSVGNGLIKVGKSHSIHVHASR